MPTGHADDRDRARRLPGRRSCGGQSRHDDIHSEPNQLCRELWKAVSVAFVRSKLEPDVLSLHLTPAPERLGELSPELLHAKRLHRQDPDRPPPRGLRLDQDGHREQAGARCLEEPAPIH